MLTLPVLEAAKSADFTQPAAYHHVDPSLLSRALEDTITKNFEQPSLHVEILLDNLRGKIAPLYHKYNSQLEPQPAYIELDFAERAITADWNPNLGAGVPEYVFNGLARRFRIPPCANPEALIRLLESNRVQSILVSLCNSYRRFEDMNGALRGSLIDSGEDVFFELEDILCNIDELDNEPWDARSWVLGAEGGAPELGDIWPKPCTVDEAVERIAEDAAHQQIRITGDIEEALLDRVQSIFDGVCECAEDEEETLSSEQIKALKLAGRI